MAMNAYKRTQQAKEERRKKWVTLISNKPKASKEGKKKALPAHSVVWTKLEETTASKIGGCSNVPLVLLTVDSPSYRARYEETIQHMQQWQKKCPCSQKMEGGHCPTIRTESCTMLNLEEFPTLGIKKIVYEGWRKVCLPKLIEDYTKCDTFINFILAAEDDIRIPDHVTPCGLIGICQDAFQSYPHIDILSLGHSWKAVQKTHKIKHHDEMNRDLLHYLEETKGAGVHGATLFAIRFPEGAQRLQEALDGAANNKKQTHFDQFLFYSPYHELNIALCDPPLVGWAEVDTTLTKSSSGHRRQGGGRLGFLPATAQMRGKNIVWIERTLVEAKNKEDVT